MTNYLIETRHSFIDLSAFMSSDYFLGSLNFNPDITQRRLGDALVETMAVRDQLQQLTGGTILQPGISEREQMQAMYQNGIDAARSLNLTPGVALSPTQIAALTNTMIWLEEQTISGQRVLVPTVYLASSAGSATDGGGAVIRGSTIALNTGNVTNSGSISATKGLTLLASGNITNSFGSISAGTDLALFANNGTFSNISGDISGRNVTISAGLVNIETTSRTLDWQYGSTTVAGPIASITATNNLSITGLAGIDMVGAALSGGAGVALLSQGNITISSVALNDSFAISSGSNASERESTRFLASTITSGAGDLTIAGDNIAITGATLSANGTIGLTATGEVQLLADTQTDYSYQFSQSSGFLHSSTYRSESFDATSIGTTLNGGAIAITAGGDITTQAADLTASTGQIGVTSTNGNIALLAAVDINASYSHSSNSYLGGLISNSSTTERLNTTIAANDLNAKTIISVDAGQNLTSVGGTMVAGGDVTLVAGETVTLAGAVSTNYTSTKSNNNSGFLITDTTEVSLTQSADFTSITAGDEIEVSGEAVVANLDASSAAFGLNAKSLIGVDSATSDQRLEISGQGPANAPSSGGGGGSGDPAYDFAGSTIKIGLPTSLDDAGYAYLDDLNASGQLTVEEMALVQHQFYDQDIQLGTLGQLLLQYVTAGMTSGLTGIQAAMARAAISGGVQGVVSGNFDIGAILTDVVFAGVSSYATSAFNLNEIMGVANGPSLLGVTNGQFSLANITNSLGDSLISAGLTTAVYGGEFGAAFLSSFQSSLSMTALADMQRGIGDFVTANGIAEGSTQHVILHALAGCVGAAAAGGDCAAGAAAGIGQSLYAGTLDGTTLSDDAQQRNAQLLGALAAAFASGGDTAATMLASNIALSGMANNRQLHRDEVEWLRNNAQTFADQMGISYEEALAILSAEALRGVSDSFEDNTTAFSDEAREFLTTQYRGMLVVDGQTMFGQLEGTTEYRNTLLNADVMLANINLLQSASSVTNNAIVNGWDGVAAFVGEGARDFAESPNSTASRNFINSLAQNPNQTQLLFATYGGSFNRTAAVDLASAFAIQRIIAALPPASQNAARVGLVMGVTGKSDLSALSAEQIDGLVLNANFGPVAELVFEGALAELGLRIVNLPSGQRGYQTADGVVKETLEEAANESINTNFRQNRKFWSQEPIEFNGNKVFQRNDQFDLYKISSWRQNGQVVHGTNLERMASGRAPIGNDGQPINLHHMTQTQGGAIAEVTQSFHQQNFGTIHINTGGIPSGINRAEFDAWKADYWRNRAGALEQ